MPAGLADYWQDYVRPHGQVFLYADGATAQTRASNLVYGQVVTIVTHVLASNPFPPYVQHEVKTYFQRLALTPP